MNSLALKFAVPCAAVSLVLAGTVFAGSKEEELLAAQHGKGKEAELLAGQHQKAQQAAAAAHAGKSEALLLAQQQQQQKDAAKAKASQDAANQNPAAQPNTTRDKASASLKDVGLLPAR
jgi:hypothetical protein